jgi:hypothetical protein
VLIDHLAAVDAAKAAPAEMEDVGDPAAVWADNEAPLAGGPGVAGDCLHGPRGQGSGVRGQGSAVTPCPGAGRMQAAPLDYQLPIDLPGIVA